MTSGEYLGDLHKKTLERLSALEKNPLLARTVDFAAARQELEAIYQEFRDKVPDTIMTGQDLQTSVRVSESQETQTQTTTQTETQTQAQVLSWGSNVPIPQVMLEISAEGLFKADSYADFDIGRRLTATEVNVMTEKLKPQSSDSQDLAKLFTPFPGLPFLRPTPFLSVRDGLARIDTDLTYVETQSDIVAKKRLMDFADVVHPDLHATLNFMPMFDWDPEKSHETASYMPYDMTQHNFETALLVKDKQSGNIKMILLSPNDEEKFKLLLTEAAKKKSIPGQEVSLALMNKHGDVLVGSPDFPQTLADAPQVIQLRAQAKFMNGDLNYSKAEEKALKEWMGDRSDTYFKEMFEKHFLPRRDRNFMEYLNSPIYHMLYRLQT